MLQKLIKTDSSNTAALVLRLTIGLVMFPHGAQKLFGMFGGYGFSGTMQYFTETAGIPWVLAFLVIIGEALGSLALIAGFATRFVAGSYILLMAGIIFFAGHLENGFFMNWTGAQAGEGYEYHLLVIGMAIALLITGSGKASVDAKLQASTN